MFFRKFIRRVLDPHNVRFTYTNRVLMNNYFRFESLKEFTDWQKNISHKKFAKKVNHQKIVPGSTLVILNNFNRLYSLKKLIAWLSTLKEHVSILIIDNLSSYPPLLAYYQRLMHAPNIQVIELGYNSGRKGIFHIVKGLQQQLDYFVVSDTDLIPYSNTPVDILSKMKDLLDRYPAYNHVGASLEINDLPNHSPLKNKVKQWEDQYWSPQTPLLNNEVYSAPVDTTFAMYRKTSNVLELSPALRMDRPYTLQHLDWYIDPKNLPEEFRYYLKNCKNGESSWIDCIRKNNLLNRECFRKQVVCSISDQ